MSAILAQKLRKLASRFQRVARSIAEGRRVLKLAYSFEEAAKKLKLSPEDTHHLRELLLGFAAAMSRFTPAAVAALSLPAAAANVKQFIGAAYQVEASCIVLSGFDWLFDQLLEWRGLSDKDILRLMAAAQLMLAASPLLHAAMRRLLQPAAIGRRAAGAAGSVDAMLGLPEAECELQQAAAELVYAPQLQLSVLARLCATLESHRPQVAAAFARSTARPETALPWLKGAIQMMRAIPGEAKGGKNFQGGSVPGVMMFVTTILHARCWSRHSDGIAADPALQAAIVEVLLTDGIQAVAAAVAKDPLRAATAQLAGTLVHLLEHERLLGAARQQLQQPEASSQAAAALGRAIAALPAQSPAGADRSQLASLFREVAAISARPCGLIGQEQPAEVGGRADGSSPDGSDGSSGAAHVAVWAQLAAQALPKFASALWELAGPNGPAASDADYCRALAGICVEVRNMLLVCPWSTAGQPVSAWACSAWAEAVTAGLRLQPLLSQLDVVFRQHSNSGVQQAAQQLSLRLYCMSMDGVPGLVEAPDEAAKQASAAALPQLLQLHSVACRMIHSLAGSGASLAAYETLTNQELHGLLFGLDRIFQAALHLCVLTRASPLEEQREAQALSVGHLAAVNAALAAAAGLPAADGYPGRPTDMVATTVLSLIQIGEACPGAVTRALLQPVQTELLALRQEDVDRPKLLGWLADACSSHPRVASSLVSNGLLARALDCASQLATSDDGDDGEQAGVLLDSISCCLGCLAAAGELVGGGAAGGLVEGSTAGSLAVEAAQAASCLQDRLAAVQQDSAAPLTLAERAAQMQQLLPAAERIAAAMDAVDRLPDQQVAVQLEVARAAAPRHCSNLRCANLAAAGGAVMYRGDHGLRCSACHVSWYCGTACSHADWREGGHRRVCKLLGEERGRRKAAAAAHAREE